jgi:ribosomal protein L25 (general stress protein Ctc)
MPAPIDERLQRAILSSEAAGKVVTAARINGQTIELLYGEGHKPAPIATTADLVNWKRK